MYSRLLPVEEFGIDIPDVASAPGFSVVFGILGTQLIAHREVPVLFQREQPREAVGVMA